MSSELPDLPAVTTLDGDELFYVVDDPAGTPTDGKITADDLAAFAGGAGAVASVNGETGVVVLDATDVGADPAGTATTAVAAEAALARNADNLTSGTVADARVAATIARDTEVTAAVAAEATLARNGDNITSGTVADARVASTIARDTEVTAAVAVEEAARIAADALKANAANPIFTGTVTVPDGALTIADTNGLQAAIDAKANAANPVFTGTVTIPDAALAIADTSGLQTALDAKAPLASPTLTGNPTAPTPSPGDADTSIATTAFVDAAVDAAAVQISDLSTVTPLWVLAEDASEVTGKWNPLAHDVHTETANYTLALTDVDGIVLVNNASSRSITYPQDSDVPIPVGSSGIIASIQGTVTHTAGTGATVPLASEGILATNGAWCYWLKTAANTFQILSPSGYLTAHNLAYNHTLIATAVQAAPARPKITAQYYFLPAPGPKSTSTFATLSQLQVTPVYLPAGTLDRIGIECTTTVATAVARLGVYSDTGGLPDALIAEATGTANLNSSTGYQTLTISAVLPTTGRYWLAVVPQTANGTIRSCTAGDGMSWIPIGTTLPTAGTGTFGVLGDAGVTGALPNPIGGLTTGLAAAIPQFHIRYSA